MTERSPAPEEAIQEAAAEKREVIWCESVDWSSPLIFTVEGGGIGIDVGGNVVVMPVRKWHALAWNRRAASEREKVLEQCAVIADDIAGEWPDAPEGRHDDWRHGRQDGAMEVAAAIRAALAENPDG